MSTSPNGTVYGMDKLAMARSVAEEHLKVDPYLESVFLLEPPDGSDSRAPIRLLEVVDGTVEGDPLPIGFAADPARGRPYPFAVVEISPREYLEIANGRLPIYNDIWTVGERLAHDEGQSVAVPGRD